MAGRLYTVVWIPAAEELAWWKGALWNVHEWCADAGAVVVSGEEVLLGMHTDWHTCCGWWRMRVMWPQGSPSYRKAVWVAPKQLQELRINKPVWVWCMPHNQRQAECGALWSHELGMLSRRPWEEDCYLMNCAWDLRTALGKRHTGFCRRRVKVYVEDELCVLRIILAILCWREQDQPSMWCHCTFGKHRSQSARSIVCLFTGAHRGRERPERSGWCDCEEMTGDELSQIFTDLERDRSTCC